MKNTLKRGFFKAFGLIALAAVIGFSLAGCGDGDDDGGGSGKTVTFTLAKVDNTSFTITVDGADWALSQDDLGNAYSSLFAGSLEVPSVVSGGYTYATAYHFSYSISGKVITCTASYGSLRGTLEFHGSLNSPFSGGSTLTDGGEGGTTTYVGKPAEGITW